MTDHGIGSRPRYAKLAIDPIGHASLLVCDLADLPGEAFAPGNRAENYAEIWTVAGPRDAIPSHPAGPRFRAFRAAGDLLGALRRHLAYQRMGFRLHAIGIEPFLWAAAEVAEQAGMGRDEYQLFQWGSRARRVFCVHCRTNSDGVSTNLVECGGCGATLLVRDHFSRRLNAFMGVQVDAEAPGVRPEIEELYP